MMDSGDGTADCLPLSVRIIQLVADLERADPIRLTPPLNDVVDPDALDALFSDQWTPSSGHVVFEYCGYEVFAYSNGRVTVECPADDDSITVSSWPYRE